MNDPASARLAIRLLVLAGTAALTGAAHSQSLDVPVKFTYKGTVVIINSVVSGCRQAYTVPAGVSFRVTDMLLSNPAGQALTNQYVCAGTSSCTTALTNFLTAPAGGTVVINTTTGPRLDAGSNLYVCNDPGASYAQWTIYGYLYTNP